MLFHLWFIWDPSKLGILFFVEIALRNILVSGNRVKIFFALWLEDLGSWAIT